MPLRQTRIKAPYTIRIETSQIIVFQIHVSEDTVLPLPSLP